MKENKRLDINYKAYTRLVIRQKLPFFVVGVSVFILTFTIIFSKFIIGRQTNSNKTTNNQKNKQKKVPLERLLAVLYNKPKRCLPFFNEY